MIETPRMLRRGTLRSQGLASLRRAFTSFRRSEAGFVLVFLGIAIPAILGLIGLALDGVRFTSLDTELANVADAAALAAAGRLDRSDRAIQQAREAAFALLNKVSDDATDGAKPRLSFRFAASLSDLQQHPNFTLSDTAGSDAAFVEVRTGATSLAISFLQLVGVRAVPLQRRAIAESKYYACDVTPTVLCHRDPAEFAKVARPGNQYLLRMDGNLVDGSIVLLDRPDQTNERATLLTLAESRPKFCYAEGVRLRTNISPTEYDEALNVRFDRYVGQNGPISPDLAGFPPAPNVIQGRHFESCTALPQGGDIDPPYSLPRDSAFQGFRPSGFWNGGVGDWKVAPPLGGTGLNVRTALDEYLAWNHADQGTDILDRLRNAPTRYDFYLAELGLTREAEATPVDTRSLGPSTETMPTGGPITGSLSLRRERAAPACYTGAQPPVEARRRILYLSIADCEAFSTVDRAEDLSRYVGKFFLTEPSDSGVTLAEFVDFLRPLHDDAKLRHVVQLVSID